MKQFKKHILLFCKHDPRHIASILFCNHVATTSMHILRGHVYKTTHACSSVANFWCAILINTHGSNWPKGHFQLQHKKAPQELAQSDYCCFRALQPRVQIAGPDLRPQAMCSQQSPSCYKCHTPALLHGAQQLFTGSQCYRAARPAISATNDAKNRALNFPV